MIHSPRISQESQKSAVDLGNCGTGPACIELCGKQTLILRTTAFGQRPACSSGELRPGHPTVRLEVEKALLDVAAVEAEAGRDPVGLREAQQAHRMKSQRGGV